MSVTDLVIALGYPLVLFVVAFLIEERIGAAEPVFAVPHWLRVLVGGAALGGPWLLYWNGYLDGVVVEFDLFVPLTLGFVLWLGLDRLVGVARRESGTC